MKTLRLIKNVAFYTVLAGIASLAITVIGINLADYVFKIQINYSVEPNPTSVILYRSAMFGLFVIYEFLFLKFFVFKKPKTIVKI